MHGLEVADDGPIRVMTLNRPAVKNALTRELIAELQRRLAAATEDDTVRVLVLTGAGDAFCAGLDLAELEGTIVASEAEHHHDTKALADLLLALVRCPKPVVAAVNGPAVAGGAGLVSACDVAFAAPSARMGYTEARIGFVAALVSVLLVRQVGEKQARELLLGAHLIGADRAAAIGLVNEVVSGVPVLDRAMQFAGMVAANAPGSLAATKRLLLRVTTAELEDAMAEAIRVNVASRSGAELTEGVRAFLEKREPDWRNS